MELIKKINNNFALAKDSKGSLVIVSGKGIGFQKMPTKITDLSVISHTYYDVSNRFVSQFETIPDDVMDLSNQAVRFANHELKKELNHNLIFTLADHINFVIERTKKGIFFNYGISNEIRYLHPEEMRVADAIVKHINKKFDCRLPTEEVAIIALHLLEAENISNDKIDSIDVEKIINDLLNIISSELNIVISKDDFNYFRFSSHMQYLIKRKDKEKFITTTNNKMFDSMVDQFPEIYKCVIKIKDYFYTKLNWKIVDEELLYLMLHINRLCSKEDCNQ